MGQAFRTLLGRRVAWLGLDGDAYGCTLNEAKAFPMIGAPIGLLYANAVEWVVHKYFLHQLGKKKGSFWSFHWREHHRNVRKYGMKDPDYQKPITDWNARGKEAAGIFLLCAAHLPLAGVAPYFTATVCY